MLPGDPTKPGTTKPGLVDISSWQCRKLRKISPNFACFSPHYFRGHPRNFGFALKFSQIPITWQSFTAIWDPVKPPLK